MKKQQNVNLNPNATANTTSPSSQVCMPGKTATVFCLVLLIVILIGTVGLIAVPWVRQLKATTILRDSIGDNPHAYASSNCFLFGDNYKLDTRDHKSFIELPVFNGQPKWMQDGLNDCQHGDYNEQAQYAAALNSASRSLPDAVVDQCYSLGYAMFTAPDEFDSAEIEHIRSNFNCRLLDGVAG